MRRTFEQCSNTPGPDGVTGLMIDCADRDSITECLLHLWNKVWISHRIPEQWKLEHRKLIPKPGKDSYNDCSAYRTVSITDILGKRFEKVISARLTCELEYKGFDEQQFAYLKHRSSTQAVLTLVEMIRVNLLKQNTVGALFFDFTDAFGSVNRTKLVYKLKKNFDISGRLFLYIVSFLSGRRARIAVNELVGEWIDSEFGTSAGTILGPLLFLVYVQDTPKDIYPKFADDLVSLVADNDVSVVERRLQEVLHELEEWSEEWDMTLNISKTKVMVFGSHQARLNLRLHGTVVEQVDQIKYLGVWLDQYVTFMKQAEYAASKATKAGWKINRLIEGRKGLSPATGIALYKGLVRPCWEFSLAAWAIVPERGIKLLEQVQRRCLGAILGAKANASQDAIDIITNVTPVRNRIQQICALEYLRIMQKPHESNLRHLLRETPFQQSGFTPMNFLQYQAKMFRCKIEDTLIESEYKLKSTDILEESRVEQIDIIEHRASGTTAVPQDVVEAFIRQHRHQSVIAFTDGAVSEAGRGGSAVLLIPLESGVPEIEASQSHSTCISSLEAEIEAIALAMEQAANYFAVTTLRKSKEKFFILTDCKSAISYIARKPILHQYHTVLSRVRVLLQALHSLNVVTALAWIPGHSGVFYNERADSMAKLALSRHADVSEEPLTFPSCKSLILKQVVARWQDRWDNSTTGRVTYEMIPVVGYKTIYPRNRCIAVSYARLLLHDTSLKDHQYRLGLEDTRVCECGQGIEDDYHFFFECTRYTDSRNRLIQVIKDVWSHAGCKGVPRWSITLLLVPSSLNVFTKVQCQDILMATFTFIKQTGRRL